MRLSQIADSVGQDIKVFLVIGGEIVRLEAIAQSDIAETGFNPTTNGLVDFPVASAAPSNH